MTPRIPLPRIRLEPVAVAHESMFLAAARRSRALHSPWVHPPQTVARFRRYVSQHTGERHIGYLAFSAEGELVGVINISEIVRGVFQSAYLGYCAFEPHQRRGYMTAALHRVLRDCFGKHRLHRLEANIQPANRRSVSLIKRLGFVKEGFSSGYLKVGGRWQDHERWALTRERWKAVQGARHRQAARNRQR